MYIYCNAHSAFSKVIVMENHRWGNSQGIIFAAVNKKMGSRPGFKLRCKSPFFIVINFGIMATKYYISS